MPDKNGDGQGNLTGLPLTTGTLGIQSRIMGGASKSDLLSIKSSAVNDLAREFLFRLVRAVAADKLQGKNWE